MKTKLLSPSKSQGAHTPRRKSRRTLSVGSPALSTASGRLSSVVQGFVNKEMNSFVLSPLPKRRSVLTDNTDIMDEPRRKSWWKNLNENSRNVFEILDHNNIAGPEPNNIMEELDIEILSQEKKNYTLDIPESSDGESIHSIILPQRKLFNQKESHHQKFGKIIGNRESMTKSNKNMTINDKVVNAGTKELFQNKPRSKLLFPPALLDISPDKTIADKTKEFADAAEPKTQPRNIFGNRQGTKRKNMFADFIATESDDEIPEIQPRVFGFPKKPELIRRGSSASRGIRESSPMSNVTTDTEMDEWRMLPSSTMVEHQLEAMLEQNTPKRVRLSKLSETKESSGTSTVSSKTKSPEVNTSVLTRSRLRALNNSGTSTVGGKNKTQVKSELNQSKKNNQHDQSQNNKSKGKVKENNINSEQNEDQNHKIANMSQGKINKSIEKHNKSLQKTIVSLKIADEITNEKEVVGNEQDENQGQEVVDGNQEVNVVLEASKSQNQTDRKQDQQNEVNVNLENSKHKVIAESQEVEESDADNESKNNEENNEVEETELENEDHLGESENDKNDSQEVAENSDKNEINKSQYQINESQEPDNENEEQANESVEQEDECQVSDQSRAELNESNEAINQSQEDEENDEDIDQTADRVNESNQAADESQEIDKVEEVDEGNLEEANENNEIADESQVEEEDEENDESNQAADESNEIADESQVNDEEDDENNEAADESNEITDESQVNDEEEEEVDENNEATDVSVEVQNESQSVIEDDENEANEHDENTQEEMDEQTSNVEQIVTQEDDDDENDVQNQSELAAEDDENDTTEQEEADESNLEENDGNEAVEDEDESAELHYESASEEMEVDDEPQNEDDTPIGEENNTNTPEPVDNEYNISHDTTGRNRNKHTSPEAILHDKTKQLDSFSARRNTSIRKTKSVVNLLNGKPSLMPARDSVGFSDGTTNSSAEGSGWDSHRTTRKTIRQTFGRDATPRKSLRALVMEKSAKRHTLGSETAKFPLANSTAVPEISLGYLDLQPVHQESTHEVSLRTRQLTLDTVLEKIKEDNLKKKAAIEESVKKSLETRSDNHIFKVPLRPMFPRRQANKESKPSKVKSIWRGLPEEMIEDLQYRPPKRFQPSNAPWINKRLYKYLETKLEPKYDYKARVRAEKLVETLYNFTKDLRRQSAATEDATNVLKHEMARLQIVRTHHDYYEFFRQFMPKEIRIKVIPDVVNKIPLPRRDVFSDIIVMDSAQG